MKQVSQLNELKLLMQSDEKVWLLLYKKGSEQSDCAFDNFSKIERSDKSEVLCCADVTTVRDIHPAYNITSVPSLLYFEKGILKNVIKGVTKRINLMPFLTNLFLLLILQITKNREKT